MWNLNPLSAETALAYFDQISDAKQDPRRGRLKSMRSMFADRSKWYLENTGQLRVAIPHALLPEPHADLVDAYDAPTKPLAALKLAIREAQSHSKRGICPYCGIGPAGTHDHALPKECYPEFSVLAQNLVPCCGDCNPRRGHKRWQETFLIYYDTICTEWPCLVARTDFTKSPLDVVFEIVPHAQAPMEFVSLLSSHVDRLGLLDRWREFARTHIYKKSSEFRGALRIGVGIPRLADTLRGTLVGLRQEFGENCWETALYTCLVSSFEDFFAWVQRDN